MVFLKIRCTNKARKKAFNFESPQGANTAISQISEVEEITIDGCVTMMVSSVWLLGFVPMLTVMGWVAHTVVCTEYQVCRLAFLGCPGEKLVLFSSPAFDIFLWCLVGGPRLI